MSKSFRHQKMYEERQNGEHRFYDLSEPKKSLRFGNRRNELANLKVKERRRERKIVNQEMERDHDSASHRPNTTARPTWR
jgi:hypothetical protein